MCLIQNWISASSWLLFLWKKRNKQNKHRQKTPEQHNFLPSDERVTMVTGEDDQMLPFRGRAAHIAHISCNPVCGGGVRRPFTASAEHQRPKLLLKESPGAVPEGWQLLADTIWELCSPTAPAQPLIWQPLAWNSNDAAFGAICRFCVCVCSRVRLAASLCHQLTRRLVLLIHILWPGYCALIGWAAAQALEQVAW